MTPENVATRMPFVKLNSLIVAFFCSSVISRSLDMPAQPGDGDAGEADGDAEEDDPAGRRPEHLARELAVEDRRHEGAERGAVAEGHGHAERHARGSAW